MLWVILGVLGLALGSFINAYVWRLHENSKHPKAKKLSIVSGRSLCPHCRHTLAPVDLIPVFSWLMLKGKCRYCHKPISFQYPLVELSTTLLFLLSYALWPLKFNSEGKVLFVYWLVILVYFIALFVYDLRWKLLPNKLVSTLIVITASQLAVKIIFFSGSWTLLTNALLAVVCSAGLFYVLFSVSDGRWIGGGDVKLAIALGLLLGTPGLAILMIFIASLVGCVVSLPLLLVNKLGRTSTIPFGPFLLVATTISYFYGISLINWYVSFIGR